MSHTTAEQIHRASLALLGDPGIRIEHDGILESLLAKGARPGQDAQVVRLSRQLIDDCLSLCPKQFPLTDRRGRETLLSATSAPTFWSCPGMYLHSGGEHRPFTSGDMADLARLLEHLANLDVVFGVSMGDVPPGARDVVGLQVMAENCSKHLRVLCFTPEGAEVLAEMRPVVGDHSWFSVGFTAHGPLRWTNVALEIFRRTAGHGIPVSVNGEPMAGVSGPVTLAGTAAVGNAEILTGIVVNQLLEPGRPCIYNLGLAHVFDMRTGIAVTGAPENALLAQVSAEMGRFYDLPSASWVSTESMCPDAQAAVEKMFGFASHTEAGVSCTWGLGQLESELTLSPAQAVIDNEMLSYVARYRRGVEVTDQSLAVDLSRSVGIAGSFLDTDHTLEHFQQELYEPAVLCRQKRAAWQEAGGKRLDQRAEEVAHELSSREVDTGMTPDQTLALRDLATAFQARVATT